MHPWLDAINFGLCVVYIEGSQVKYNVSEILLFLSLKIIFVLGNSVDPDQLKHHVNFICAFSV